MQYPNDIHSTFHRRHVLPAIRKRSASAEYKQSSKNQLSKDIVGPKMVKLMIIIISVVSQISKTLCKLYSLTSRHL